MTRVVFDHATRIYEGMTEPAVDGLDLEIGDGEFLVLVGPSGCGKSTSLRMLAGLEEIDDGRVFIGERDVTDVPPAERDVAMVFQNYALYPHMTVAQNMSYALKIRGVPREQRERRVLESARMLDLEPLLGRKPKALSGGQRQRVAMGRAIVRDPEVFLMDEPLSNLDAKLRVQTRAQISGLTRRLGVTTVYVTHDQIEALTMGDRIAVLDHGHLQQIGTPRDLYAAPANVFVAGFIGSPAMNLLTVEVSEVGIAIGNTSVPLDRETRAAGGKRIVLGIRPEHLRRAADTAPGVRMIVEMVEELGADTYVYGHLDAEGESSPMIARLGGGDVPEVGAAIRLAIDEKRIHLFSEESGERLNGPAVGEPFDPRTLSATA
ncbi:MAG TPA: sn-glycerol-3-phosphate ABC transporter ATP-binding protein UgpC [Solirubrobacteraceae bacterium]|nr:sn-glycerol-3-phosphate ABC transporter ATP-binding protein UgpC [Solirubrobacteraceae bacterium]